jgi:heptosyltransferase-2
MTEALPILAPQNIIIRMPNWLGDLVMAAPILEDLRQHFPQAHITAMCQQGVAKVLAKDPNIDELFIFSKPSRWLHRLQHYNVIDRLEKGNYDLGILLTNSFSSAWWFWQGNVKNRIGFQSPLRNYLVNKAVPFPKERTTQHLVKTYKELLAPLGIASSDTNPKLYVSDEDRGKASSLLHKYGLDKKSILVGINPGAAYGSAKCWLPKRFSEVTNKLLENPRIFVVYFGDQAGKSLVDTICANTSKRVINLAGSTSIPELMALIQKCDIFLTNDSGPMHMASALGTPLLALFGSTNEIATGPYRNAKIIHKHVECSPCYKRTCPIDFRCMTKIGVNEVYKELTRMLKSS